MAYNGIPGQAAPDDYDSLVREIEELKRWRTEFMPSVSDSVRDIALEITARFPIASVIPYAVATAPEGWLLADGSAVSRDTYSDLYDAIGETYGAGDGSTTFNLPNLEGRVPVGRDTGDSSFNGLGEKGGAKTHTLTASQMPSHTHTFSDSDSHSHSMSALPGFGNSGAGTFGTGVVSNAPLDGFGVGYFTNSATVNISGTTSSSGSGVAHNNLQPYIALPYIIKHYKY